MPTDNTIKDDNTTEHLKRGFRYRCKDPCVKCGMPGERFCFGNAGEKYEWGMFCLKCEPFNK
jgi:hypothetical protein